jgi:hypothetical protein
MDAREIGLAMAGAPHATPHEAGKAHPNLPRRAGAGARIGAIAFTLLISALLVLWAGAPVGQTYALLLKGGFGSVLRVERNPHPRHPADPHRPGGHRGVQGAPVQHRRRGQLYAGALAAVAVGGLHGGTGFECPPGCCSR